MTGSMRGTLQALGVFVGTGVLASCRINADRPWKISNLESEVRLVSDSPHARLLISSQERADDSELRWLKDSHPHDEATQGRDERRRYPHQYAATLVPFIAAMRAEPAVVVPGGTLCRVIEHSQARCTPDPLGTLTYVKVQMLEGPKRGQQGWAREGRDVFSTTPSWP